MDYYLNTILKNITFNEAVAKVIHELKNEGFGIITEIDMKSILKQKIDVDFYNYKILGACSPNFAYKALQIENKIGTMLPCNVIIQEKEKDIIEVSAIDPAQSMISIKNNALTAIAKQVREKLKKVIQNI